MKGSLKILFMGILILMLLLSLAACSAKMEMRNPWKSGEKEDVPYRV